MTEREIEAAFQRVGHALNPDDTEARLLLWRLERRMVLQHIAAEVLAKNTVRDHDERHLKAVT